MADKFSKFVCASVCAGSLCCVYVGLPQERERESCVLTLDHAMQLYQFAKTLQDNFKLSDVTV